MRRRRCSKAGSCANGTARQHGFRFLRSGLPSMGKRGCIDGTAVQRQLASRLHRSVGRRQQYTLVVLEVLLARVDQVKQQLHGGEYRGQLAQLKGETLLQPLGVWHLRPSQSPSNFKLTLSRSEGVLNRSIHSGAENTSKATLHVAAISPCKDRPCN